MQNKSKAQLILEAEFSKHLPRRDFMALSAALSFLAACRPYLGALGSENKDLAKVDGKGKRVIVLGGGIAGLCSAYRLQEQGFQVVVLEKTNRISGRVWTNHGFFEDDQYCEFGATRLPDCHDLTRAYADLLGLEYIALGGDDDNVMYHLDGVRRYKLPGQDASPWPEDRAHIDSTYASQAFPLLGNPKEERWPRTFGRSISLDIKHLDSLTFADYLKEAGFSDFARKVVKASNGSEVDMFSASMWLAAEYLEQTWDKTHRIKGGNQQISEKLAAPLFKTNSIQLRADVRRVEQLADKGVRVSYQQGGELRQVEGDYVICALPMQAFKKIDWLPGLSAMKMQAAGEVTMQAVTRINMQFKKRFWEQAPFNVRGLKVLHSDLPIERLWDMTGSADQKTRTGKVSEKGILTAYIQHDLARAAGKYSPEERMKFALEQVEAAFPGSRDLFIKGSSWVWHEQEWVGGGWAAYRPGQIDLYLASRQTEGRIHFAGDHTTLEAGWIQGALESAHRVYNEIAADITTAAKRKA